MIRAHVKSFGKMQDTPQTDFPPARLQSADVGAFQTSPVRVFKIGLGRTRFRTPLADDPPRCIFRRQHVTF